MSPSPGQCQTLPLVNIGAEWEPERRAFIRLFAPRNTHRVQMGTPKRFQLATLWDNDAGFHTNEGSKIPPERYLNAPHHQPHRLHTLQCTDMRYMCIKTHFLLSIWFIAHVLHKMPGREPISHCRDSGCCQSVWGS